MTKKAARFGTLVCQVGAIINIVELLKLRGLDEHAKIKLVRHQDKRHDLYELVTSGLIETYQASQSKPVLECDYMVSFIGLPHGQARFLGVYRVTGRSKVAEVELPKNYTLPENPDNFFYFLEKVPGFEDLEQRIVIYWGESTRSWHQWLSPKEVVQVLPKGFARPFPGYLDFILPHQELVQIVSHPEPNRAWHTALTSVAGIYLIVQSSTGAQYVGSAYGPKGILGRWEAYARSGHGDNERLKELHRADPYAHREFRYSVLRTLSKSLTAKEVLAYETFYKTKLGTRAFGLNAN